MHQQENHRGSCILRSLTSLRVKSRGWDLAMGFGRGRKSGIIYLFAEFFVKELVTILALAERASEVCKEN